MDERRAWTAGGAVAAAAILAGGLAAAAPKHAAVAKAELKWADAGIPGVQTAAVQGDLAKGPSHFFLKYPAGFQTPRHHHTADHYVTTVSGTQVLAVDGQEQRLPPGSYFQFTEKAVHAARCEGGEACVMFVDARSAWDVVPEQP
jgi:quercetin dioxygenase-like cupin family protein